MKGTSKVIMGATLVMVVSLAIVLGLILVLLAELYCSLLLHRRRLRTTDPCSTTTPITATMTNITGSTSTSTTDQSTNSPLSSSYLGVLRLPNVESKKNLHSQLHHILSVHRSPPETAALSPRTIGVLSTSSPPKPLEEISIQINTITTTTSSGGCIKSCGEEDSFMYISNPVYDNGADTPFETPDTSPSRLETAGSSSDDFDDEERTQPSKSVVIITPPLTPMKKLPAEASSVSMGDGTSRSLLGSDHSMSNNGVFSSSSSGSPCTSPSW